MITPPRRGAPGRPLSTHGLVGAWRWAGSGPAHLRVSVSVF